MWRWETSAPNGRCPGGYSSPEGVSELWICYLFEESERHNITHVIAGHADYATAALSLLPRHRYCAPWHLAGRQATVSMSRVPGAWTHVSPRLQLCRPIA